MTTRSDELLDLVLKRVGTSERRQERLALEETWLTLRLFWENRSDVDVIGGRVFSGWTMDNDPDEIRYKVNMIRAQGDTSVAKVLSVDAQFQARPPTSSKRDRDAADVTNKVFQHIREVTDHQLTHHLSTTQAMIYGSSVVEVGWDPRLGEPDRYYYDAKESMMRVPPVLLNDQQKQQKEAMGLFEDLAPGDISLELHSPFGFHWDTASRDKGIAGCHWVATRHFVDIERVAEAFNVDEHSIMPVETDGGLINYEEAIAYMNGIYGSVLFSMPRPEEKRGKRTLMIHLWQRPDSKNKKGLHVVYAGGRILNADNCENPFGADRSRKAHLPFVKQDWKPRPGNFWGVGQVEDALQPQYYLNKARSSKIEYAEQHGMPPAFVSSDSGIDTDTMTLKPGALYRTRSSSPQPMQIGPAPQQTRDVLDANALCEGDLNKVMSQSPIDGGKMPGQIRSGAGIRSINEERFAGLTIPARMSVRSIRDTGNICLSIAKLRYSPTTERLYRYYGEDNEWAVAAFTSMDIVNDIVIIGEPDVSDSIAGQREELLDMLNMGFFDPNLPPETRTLLIKAYRFKTADELISRQIQAENSQDREIEEMIADPLKYGDMGYPVMPWEDHQTEMNAIVAFMYSSDAKALQKTPEGARALAVITKHWQDHAMMLAQQQAAMQQMNGDSDQEDTPGRASQPKKQEQPQ